MSGNKQFYRLQDLRDRLNTGDYFTIAQLAEELDVSSRTINRDLQLLREQGLPIEADRGRGGGVQLQNNWNVGRVNLSFHEAVDLLISLAVAEHMASPIFMGHVNSIRRKISASFHKDMRPKIRQLRKRILVTSPASTQITDGYQNAHCADISVVHQAFLEKKCLEISYIDTKGNQTKRLIEPHYLVLRFPIWYILAWDQLRDDVRSFRFDRIEGAAVKEDFKLRQSSDFDRILEYISGNI